MAVLEKRLARTFERIVISKGKWLTHLSLRCGFLDLSARETAKPQALNVESRRLASMERIVDVSSHGSRHCLLISTWVPLFRRPKRFRLSTNGVAAN